MGKRRDNQKFTNPGGHLNPGEDPVKGAVREVKEETGLELDPHLFKHLETRIVTKKDGGKIEVHGFRVDLRHKPSTSMKQDPDGEVFRWQWIKTDSDLGHISENLHVPLKDNVLLTHILKDKPMRKHVKRFWDSARKMGVGDELKDKLLKEGPQQYLQRKEREKKAAEVVSGGKADGKPDSDFREDQLKKGRKVEREHTNNPALANEISKDHLEEFPNYYTALGKMEDGLKKKAFWRGFEGRRK
jgi:8-oxo-dGTP pyrophosphatase MutT (NUDIX family)